MGMTNVDSGDLPVIGWICIDSAKPQVLAAWWKQLLGGVTRVDDDGDVHLDAGPIPLLFLRVADPKMAKNRVHLDLRVTNYEEAVSRAMDLGATRADDVYGGDNWQVLRDPEGNEFCILRPKAES